MTTSEREFMMYGEQKIQNKKNNKEIENHMKERGKLIINV